VTSLAIQAFSEPPDVIVWGERLFVVPDIDRDLFVAELADDEHGYVEAFVYAWPGNEVNP
jgi:hypothetical protein